MTRRTKGYRRIKVAETVQDVATGRWSAWVPHLPVRLGGLSAFGATEDLALASLEVEALDLLGGLEGQDLAEACGAFGMSGADSQEVGARLMVRSSSACPFCGERHVMDLVRVVIAQRVGTFSLAGVQTKVPAKMGWVFRCTACAASGGCEAPVDALMLMAATVGRCGHALVTDHYRDGDCHDIGCSGCCPVCQRIKDQAR